MTNREWLNTLSNEDFVHYLIAPCDICANADKNCTEHSAMSCFEGCVKGLEQERHCEDSGEDEYETPDDIYFDEYNETRDEQEVEEDLGYAEKEYDL